MPALELSHLHLPEKYLAMVQSILKNHLPDAEVWAYGSRVNGDCYDASDLDLVARRPDALECRHAQLYEAIEAFSESNLPILVQVVDWASIPAAFHREIEAKYVVVQVVDKTVGRVSPKGVTRQAADNAGTVDVGLRENANPTYSAEWPIARLGGHVDACLGKMLDGKKNKGTPQPYLGNSNVRWGRFDLQDLAQMRFEPHEEARYSLLPGDLVVCEGGEPGRCAIWTGPAGMKVQKALHRIRPKQSLDNYYLFYWFQLAAKNGLLEPYFTGTTIKHLTGKAITILEVPLPPIEVQRAMADVLKHLDDRIALLRETNATLEAIAQALFKSWFVDFDPVHANASLPSPPGRGAGGEGDLQRPYPHPNPLPKGEGAGLPPDIAALFPDSFEESELGLVPRGWQIEPLTGAFDFKEGPGIRNWQYTNSDQGTRFINIRCIQNGDLSIDTANRIADEEANGKYAHFHLKAWDVVVSTSGTLGRSAIVRQEHLPLMLNTSVIRFRPIAGKTAFCFLYEYLNAPEFLFKLESMASGSVQKNFGPMHLKQMKLICPPFELVSYYEEIAKPLFDKLIENRAQAQTLATLRDTLLPRLISGQLRLPEAEAELEEAAA